MSSPSKRPKVGATTRRTPPAPPAPPTPVAPPPPVGAFAHAIHDLALRIDAAERAAHDADPAAGPRVRARSRSGTARARRPAAARVTPADVARGRIEDLRITLEELQVTEAQLAEVRDQLENERARYHDLFQFAPDGYLITDPKGSVVEANRAAAELLRVDGHLLIAKPLLLFVHKDDRPAYWQAIRGMRDRDRIELELRLNPRKAATITARVAVAPITGWGGKLQGVRWMLRDVTEQRRAAEQLLAGRTQLQSLTTELSLAEERERRRIAVGLHDRVSQTLATVMMTLGGLRAGLTPAKRAAVEDVARLLQQAIEETRTLTFELSPPILYELGFVPAVEWLGDQLKRRHKVTVHVDAEGATDAADANRVVLFQFVREMLANVVKHAKATSVAVTVRATPEELRLGVTDDGVGCDPTRLVAARRGTGAEGGFGLFNIRTRVEQLGGRVDITTRPGHGTRVLVTLPMSHGASHESGAPADAAAAPLVTAGAAANGREPEPATHGTNQTELN